MRTSRSRRSCSRPTASTLATFATLLAASATADGPRYQLTIYPTAAGQPSAYPFGMNEAGQIVGSAASDRFDPVGVPVLASGGSTTALPTLPDTSFNFAQAINDAGLIVGVSSLAAAEFNAPAWLNPAPGYFTGFAYGVNNAGRIAGSQINDLFGIERPAWWPTPDAAARFLPGFSDPSIGAAFATNALGHIVGWTATDDGARAVRWTDPNAPPTLVSVLENGTLSEFLDTNDLGDCAGRTGFANGDTHAMLYVEATATAVDLGVLGGNYSLAHALNDSRVVVGESSTGGGVAHAFVWVDGVMYDLNDLVVASNEPYLFLSTAVDVNNAGQIAVQVQLDTPDSQARIGILTPVGPCAGDADGDFDVDLDDLLLVLGNLGCPGDCINGDVDQDGDVDFDDLLVVLGNFDSACEV